MFFMECKEFLIELRNKTGCLIPRGKVVKCPYRRGWIRIYEFIYRYNVASRNNAVSFVSNLCYFRMHFVKDRIVISKIFYHLFKVLGLDNGILRFIFRQIRKEIIKKRNKSRKASFLHHALKLLNAVRDHSNDSDLLIVKERFG